MTARIRSRKGKTEKKIEGKSKEYNDLKETVPTKPLTSFTVVPIQSPIYLNLKERTSLNFKQQNMYI